MDKHYTYLLINFFTLFFPVALSFDRRVAFFKSWKSIFPGLAITGLLFLIWDYIFTLYNVWSFNAGYIVNVYFLNLPVEEILFFITVPFACIFIYECLNCYLSESIFSRLSTAISVGLLFLSVILLVFFYPRVYSVITFALVSILSIFLLIKRPRYLGRFYRAFLVSLIPFYLVNGILTAIPVVMYNDAQSSGIRVGTIPLEDHFYSLAMFLMNIILFEYFRNRRGRA